MSLKAKLVQRVKKFLVNTEELASQDLLQLQDLETRLQEEDGCIELADLILVANLLNIRIRCAMKSTDFLIATSRDKRLERLFFEDALYGHEAALTLRVFQSRAMGDSGKLRIHYDLLTENQAGQVLLTQEDKLDVVKGTRFDAEVGSAMVPVTDEPTESVTLLDDRADSQGRDMIIKLHTYIHTYISLHFSPQT